MQAINLEFTLKNIIKLILINIYKITRFNSLKCMNFVCVVPRDGFSFVSFTRLCVRQSLAILLDIFLFVKNLTTNRDHQLE